MTHKITLLIISLCIALSGCEEAYVPISLVPPTGDKVIILEEYSGASCIPCVEGHQIIENLENIYGDNLVVVTMHTFVGGQGNPLADSNYDFRTQGGHDILEYLGYPTGIPSGVVDRTEFAGGDNLQLTKQQWAGAISEDIQLELQVILNVETTFDETSRNVSIDISMFALENITEETSITVLLTESEIHDWQATPNGKVEDYEHNNVLRAMISPTLGKSIGTLNKDENRMVNFNFTLPEADGSGPWVPEHCDIVAYLSIDDISGGQKQVLQAAKKGVTE